MEPLAFFGQSAVGALATITIDGRNYDITQNSQSQIVIFPSSQDKF
jgi:hypothetical protein